MKYTIYNSTKLEIIEMIFFIATIFIAQLIIVWNIVFFIITIDNKVNVLITNIEENSSILPELLSTIREMTEDISNIVPKIYDEYIKKRNKYLVSKTKSIIESIAILIVKPKYKKLLLGAELGLKLTKKLIKTKNVV